MQLNNSLLKLYSFLIAFDDHFEITIFYRHLHSLEHVSTQLTFISRESIIESIWHNMLAIDILISTLYFSGKHLIGLLDSPNSYT